MAQALVGQGKCWGAIEVVPPRTAGQTYQGYVHIKEEGGRMEVEPSVARQVGAAPPGGRVQVELKTHQWMRAE